MVSLSLVLGLVALFAWERSPYVAQTLETRAQPVKFDHRHHVRDDGIGCLYCHDGARRDRYAGIPDSATCMGCHDQIWINSPELLPVRESVARNVPIQWSRIHDLPDHVYFNHAVHVQKNIGCETCHGAVDRMPQVHAVKAMTMSWCLDCHREHGAPTQCTACHR